MRFLSVPDILHEVLFQKDDNNRIVASSDEESSDMEDHKEIIAFFLSNVNNPLGMGVVTWITWYEG